MPSFVGSSTIESTRSEMTPIVLLTFIALLVSAHSANHIAATESNPEILATAGKINIDNAARIVIA